MQRIKATSSLSQRAARGPVSYLPRHHNPVSFGRRLRRSLMMSMLAKLLLHIGLPIIGMLAVATGIAAAKHIGPFEPKPPNGLNSAVVLDSLVRINEFHTERATYTTSFVIGNHESGIIGIFTGHNLNVHAVGTVDVIDDFGSLTLSAMKFNHATDSVTVTMPVPQLGRPVLDVKKTTVERSDGLVTKIGRAFTSSDDEKLAYENADQMIYSQAEAQAPTLITNAEVNIQSFVTAVLMKVGVLHITVNFG